MSDKAVDWARETFEDSELGDPRRTNRLIQIASLYAKNIGSSTVECCNGDSAQIEGAYRFLRNDQISPAGIREGGFASTVRQLKRENTLLAIEDTTTVSYRHEVAKELGYTSNSPTAKTRGFHVHSILLLSAESHRTVGLIEQNWFCRNNEGYGKSKRKNVRKYHEKESYKWEHSSRKMTERLEEKMKDVISVCDRDADVYDYLFYKLHNNQRFIVRARENRNLASSEKKLFEKVFSTKSLGTYDVFVKQKGGRKARTAKVRYYSSTIEIELPKGSKKMGYPDKLMLNVVGAREENTKGIDEPLEWVILTSESINSNELARLVLKYYELRWRIEDFHKAWKSGAGVERLRLQSKDNLERGASILAFIAVKLLQIREIVLKEPEKSKKKDFANYVLAKDEWKALWLAIEKSSPPKKPPTIEWVYYGLGKLGGWYDSKRTGIIGWKALWKGWFRLMDRVESYSDARIYL